MSELNERVDPTGQTSATVAVRRVGVARGEFEVPEDIDGDNEWILDLFSTSKG
jgi:hypothetical protein